MWRRLVELWQAQVITPQARAETTSVPDNSPLRNQALQTSAGPRQHPTPASSGKRPRPRPPLAPGDARFGPESPRLSDSAGFGMESSRSNPSPSNECSPKNRSIIRGPSPCLLVPISFSRHGKDPPLEPPLSLRAFPHRRSPLLPLSLFATTVSDAVRCPSTCHCPYRRSLSLPLFAVSAPIFTGRPSAMFGANRGPKPSADGLASPTKMKTFWVIKLLHP